jgi:putative spermidine/putrescine transport system ATP-binding protein
VKDLNLDMRQGRIPDDARPVGLGQDHLPDDAGRASRRRPHGDIRLNGRPINNVPPHKRGIGMVFQNYACSRT